MRIRVSHETTIAFSGVARSLQLAARATPRGFDSQYVLTWRVDVGLDAVLRRREDAFGNLVHTVSWHKPADRVTLRVSGDVETSDSAGVVRGAVDPLPPEMFLRASPLAQPNADLRAFGEEAGQGASDTLDRLHRLSHALHKTFAFERDFNRPLGEVWALKRSDAAGFAHAFVACARQAQIPARFVSGYRIADGGGDAWCWAEALAPGLGWVGFDCVHAICPSDDYVRVATGLDGRDAAPLRIWHNGGDSFVSEELRVEQATAQSQN